MPCDLKESLRLAKTLVGLTLAEAELVSKQSGRRVRLVEEDGQLFIGTRDYDSCRINVTVIKKTVVKAQVG